MLYFKYFYGFHLGHRMVHTYLLNKQMTDPECSDSIKTELTSTQDKAMYWFLLRSKYMSTPGGSML